MQDNLFAIVKQTFKSDLEAKERKEELLEELKKPMQQNANITVFRRGNRVEVRIPWANPLVTVMDMTEDADTGMQIIAKKVFEILDAFPDDWNEMTVSLYWRFVDND